MKNFIQIYRKGLQNQNQAQGTNHLNNFYMQNINNSQSHMKPSWLLHMSSNLDKSNISKHSKLYLHTSEWTYAYKKFTKLLRNFWNFN